MKEHFTSDDHLGHNAIIGKMGRDCFATIEDHDNEIIEQINSRVAVRDRLWILGDFAWNAQRYRSRIRCKNIGYVIGNHDKPDDIRRSFGSFFVDRHISKWGPEKETLILYHYPIIYFDRSHRTAFHLYGHMHTNQEALLDWLFPERRSMDCGVDMAKLLLGDYRPFEKSEILDILGPRKGHDPIEYYEMLNANDFAARGGSLEFAKQFHHFLR